MFQKIKRFYDLGIYSKEHVAQFVSRGVITPEQYTQITGEPYEPAE